MVPENHKDDPRDLDGWNDPLADADGFDLDEDLFDFPELDLVEPIAIQQDSLLDLDAPEHDAPQAAPAAASKPVERPMPEPRSADGNDFTPGDPLEEASFDLDEDLFDFGEVFDSIPEPSAPTSKPIAKPSYDEAPAAKVSGTAPSSTATSRQGSSSDLVDLDAASTLTPTPAATSKSSSAPVRGTTDQPARASEGFDPRTAPAAPTSETPARKSRIVEVLAICFLVVNVSMVFFAWRAGDEFRQTLAHVSGSVNEALIQNANTKSSAPIQPDPIVEVMPGPFDIEVETQDPVSVPSMSRTALELARRRLENAEFEDARRGLQRLLANQDRASLEAGQVAEAELLIARSYYLEGLEIREDV
mgnify:CR=1 FL=1|tara:strand:+ start:1863 stop:2945 length:1083 start_codon:yes stop_codon:yes gene_type:complete